MQNAPQPVAGRGRPARRRKLNIGAIKANIVFVVSLVTAVIGGLTGLGTQVALAPMLTWMLGFSREKSQATAIPFAAVAATAAVVGALIANATPASYFLRGVSLFTGALVGAVVAAPLSRRLQTSNWRRITQTLGIMITLAVIVQVGRAGRFDVPNFAQWNTPGPIAVLGAAVGALTQMLSLPSGALLVPSLYFFGAFPPVHAITLSLLVVALAALLPAIGYSRSGLADNRYLASTTLAAAVGGALGGRLLPPVGPHDLFHYKILITVSAAIAMFFCGRELSRLAVSARDGDAA